MANNERRKEKIKTFPLSHSIQVVGGFGDEKVLPHLIRLDTCSELSCPRTQPRFLPHQYKWPGLPSPIQHSWSPSSL